MVSSSHQLTDQVKLLHKVVLMHEHSILVLKRSEASFYRPQKWDLPGGNSEWPKSTVDQSDLHAQDILREIKEETGITLSRSSFDPNTPTFLRTYFESDRKLYAIICGWHIALPDKPEITLSSEHTEFKWVSVAKSDSLDTGFDFIKDIISNSLK